MSRQIGFNYDDISRDLQNDSSSLSRGKKERLIDEHIARWGAECHVDWQLMVWGADAAWHGIRVINDLLTTLEDDPSRVWGGEVLTEEEVEELYTTPKGVVKKNVRFSKADLIKMRLKCEQIMQWGYPIGYNPRKVMRTWGRCWIGTRICLSSNFRPFVEAGVKVVERAAYVTLAHEVAHEVAGAGHVYDHSDKWSAVCLWCNSDGEQYAPSATEAPFTHTALEATHRKLLRYRLKCADNDCIEKGINDHWTTNRNFKEWKQNRPQCRNCGGKMKKDDTIKFGSVRVRNLHKTDCEVILEALEDSIDTKLFREQKKALKTLILEKKKG